MKEFRGSAGAPVKASAATCLELARDVGAYPEWYPEVVRQAEVLSAGRGHDPVVARARVHAQLGPLNRDFDLLLEVRSEGDEVVRLTRVGHEPSDPEQLSLLWRVQPAGATVLTVEITARLDVPRLLPLHGAAEAVARGFLSAGRRALEHDP